MRQVTLRRSDDTVAVSQCYLSQPEPGVPVLHVNGAQIVSVSPEELMVQFDMSLLEHRSAVLPVIKYRSKPYFECETLPMWNSLFSGNNTWVKISLSIVFK